MRGMMRAMPPPKRRALRSFVLVVVAAVGLGSAFLLVDGWRSFGKSATGARLARMEASPQWSDGVFENPQPLWNDFAGSVSSIWNASPYGSPTPDKPIAVLFGDGARFATAPASGLRVTWMGHSTLLVEIDGARILTDPIFGERASPYDWAGPKRWYAPPIPFEQMPQVDAIVISHDHYDHLQRDTIERIARSPAWRDTLFVAPLGVGAHLEYWGVAPDKIVELDWWERTTLPAGAGPGVDIVCTPARHASGRDLLDQNETLWAGYALVGPAHRAFFSGDTGLFPAMKDIGDKLGPFDVTMIEVGAYDRAWPDWHIGPEQAVQAHVWLKGRVFLPIHWGLWNLAAHGWTEPAERSLVAASAADVSIAIPRPGQSLEPSSLPPLERWWPDVPWQTAAQHPVVSTKVN